MKRNESAPIFPISILPSYLPHMHMSSSSLFIFLCASLICLLHLSSFSFSHYYYFLSFSRRSYPERLTVVSAFILSLSIPKHV